MCGGGALLVRRAVADDAVDDDHRRTIIGLAERVQRPHQRIAILGIVDMQDSPAVSLKTLADIFVESEIGVAFDRDRVAVVDPAEI